MAINIRRLMNQSMTHYKNMYWPKNKVRGGEISTLYLSLSTKCHTLNERKQHVLNLAKYMWISNQLTSSVLNKKYTYFGPIISGETYRTSNQWRHAFLCRSFFRFSLLSTTSNLIFVPSGAYNVLIYFCTKSLCRPF